MNRRGVEVEEGWDVQGPACGGGEVCKVDGGEGGVDKPMVDERSLRGDGIHNRNLAVAYRIRQDYFELLHCSEGCDARRLGILGTLVADILVVVDYLALVIEKQPGDAGENHVERSLE